MNRNRSVRRRVSGRGTWIALLAMLVAMTPIVFAQDEPAPAEDGAADPIVIGEGPWPTDAPLFVEEEGVGAIAFVLSTPEGELIGQAAQRTETARTLRLARTNSGDESDAGRRWSVEFVRDETRIGEPGDVPLWEPTGFHEATINLWQTDEAPGWSIEPANMTDGAESAEEWTDAQQARIRQIVSTPLAAPFAGTEWPVAGEVSLSAEQLAAIFGPAFTDDDDSAETGWSLVAAGSQGIMTEQTIEQDSGDEAAEELPAREYLVLTVAASLARTIPVEEGVEPLAVAVSLSGFVKIDVDTGRIAERRFGGSIRMEPQERTVDGRVIRYQLYPQASGVTYHHRVVPLPAPPTDATPTEDESAPSDPGEDADSPEDEATGEDGTAREDGDSGADAPSEPGQEGLPDDE